MTERCVLLAIRLPTLICQRIRLHISHCDWVLRWKKSVVWYWLNAVWERKFGQKSGLQVLKPGQVDAVDSEES